jgi:hypothetical protein
MSSRRRVRTKRSAIALARGARTDVVMMRTSIAVKTASKLVVNVASRSRRNRKQLPTIASSARDGDRNRVDCPGFVGFGHHRGAV